MLKSYLFARKVVTLTAVTVNANLAAELLDDKKSLVPLLPEGNNVSSSSLMAHIGEGYGYVQCFYDTYYQKREEKLGFESAKE
jgi:hypothetical protein